MFNFKFSKHNNCSSSASNSAASCSMSKSAIINGTAMAVPFFVISNAIICIIISILNLLNIAVIKNKNNYLQNVELNF